MPYIKNSNDFFNHVEVASSEESVITELVSTLKGNIKREFSTNLVHLMIAVINWRLIPSLRTKKLSVQIESLRLELSILTAETQRIITDEYIKSVWVKLYENAIKIVLFESGKKFIAHNPLTWEEVFEIEYRIF